jgi:3-oxoacyl-[acyl-carrier-protein] synthase III
VTSAAITAVEYYLPEKTVSNRVKPGTVIAPVGFGVGYSWAAALCRWGGR